MYNISNAQAIKQIAGKEPCVWVLIFQVEFTGNGRKTVRDSSLCGPICQKLLSLAMSLFTVVVRKGVEGSASVGRLH